MIRQLGEICDIQLGKMLSQKSRTGVGTALYLRNQNVQWGRFDLHSVASMDFSPREREKFRLLPGDLIVCEGGEPGRAAVWQGELSECYYQKALFRLRPRNGCADPYFLLYRLQLGAVTGEFTDSNAKTTIAHLPAVRLSKLNIDLPDLPAQRRIAALLNKQMAATEAAREALEAQQDAVEPLFEKLLSKAFRGIIPLSLGINADPAPDGWKWWRLSDVARLESGHTPSRKHPEYWENGEIPWLALPDIRALDCRVAHETSEMPNEVGIANSSARVLPASTVALSRTASVGFVTIFGRPMATSQDFVNWICHQEVQPKFLMWLLRAARNFVRSVATGAIHKTVYVDVVQRFHVCVPSIPMQDDIVKRLDDSVESIRLLHEGLQEQTKALSALPAAYLREAFQNC